MFSYTDQGTGTIIATCITDANGVYFFISGGTATTGTGTVICALLTATNYFIRIKGTVTSNKNITGNTGLDNSRFLTFANVAGNGTPGYSDNDGVNAAGTGGFYQATITTGSYGQSNQNIDFGLAASNVLPVHLISFDEILESKDVKLAWKLSFPEDGDRYEIEYCTDAVSFQYLITILATNMTDYATLHNNPLAANNYYRLKLINRDGTYFYSGTRKVVIKQTSGISIYPNPVKDKLNISIVPGGVVNILTVSVYNAGGKLVLRREVTGNSVFQLDIHRFLPGNYSVVIFEKKSNHLTSQLIQKL